MADIGPQVALPLREDFVENNGVQPAGAPHRGVAQTCRRAARLGQRARAAPNPGPSRGQPQTRGGAWPPRARQPVRDAHGARPRTGRQASEPGAPPARLTRRWAGWCCSSPSTSTGISAALSEAPASYPADPTRCSPGSSTIVRRGGLPAGSVCVPGDRPGVGARATGAGRRGPRLGRLRAAAPARRRRDPRRSDPRDRAAPERNHRGSRLKHTVGYGEPFPCRLVLLVRLRHRRLLPGRR